MTFTQDPPAVGDISLIPNADEKADLDAPASQSGKVVVSQIPNISISSTTVVADQNERLSLDVQEGDVAIQTDTSESYIFTGGANVNVNWQLLQFDAVGAIQSKDIDPRDITARDIDSSQDMTAVNLEVSDTFNGANLAGASAGDALTANGNGQLSFTELADVDLVSLFNNFNTQSNLQQTIASPTDMQTIRASPTLDTEFHLSDNYAITLDNFASINTGVTGGMDEIAVSQTAMQEVVTSQPAMQQIAGSETAMKEVAVSLIAMQEVATSQTAMQEVANSKTAMREVANSQTAMQEVAPSQTAMQEVAASQTAMEEVAASQTAMQEVGFSNTAQSEIENSTTATTVLDNNASSFSFSSGSGNFGQTERRVVPQTNESYSIYIKSANYSGYDGPCVDPYGFYNDGNSYLGEDISQIFVDTLTVGWDPLNCGSFGGLTIGANIEAVIF
jgi:hypothetical protein